MDGLTRLIAEGAAGLTFAELPDDVVHAACQRWVDTLACAIAAYRSETAQIGVRLAWGVTAERYPGRVLGYGERSTAERATFANSCMIRYLDYNDTASPGGHPSDCLGAHLAIAEAAGADGRALVTSLLATYEPFIRLSRTINLRDLGWDQGFAVAICTAAGVGHLLRLPVETLGHAVAIAAVTGLPLRNTRAGELSMWKGAATAFAARNGLYATLLAAEGMTGPEAPFEGHHGLWHQVTGPFKLEPFGGRDASSYHVTDVRPKYWPAEANAQAGIWAALELREKLDWRELAQLRIGTYQFTVNEIAGEPQKWDPQTRETADHSLPYIFARTLVDGAFSPTSFEEASYRDPSLRPLMSRIRVEVDDDINTVYPKTVILRVEATTTDGRQHQLEIRNPRGHEENRMTDDDVSDKFLRAAEPALGVARAREALNRWWSLPEVTNLTEALDLLDLPS